MDQIRTIVNVTPLTVEVDGANTILVNVAVGAGVSNSFGTVITPSGTYPAASAAEDPLTFTSDGNIEIVGDSGTDTVDFALADTAVTPGSYTNTNLTVDQQGRITAAANGTDADTGITELTGDVTAGPGSGSQVATLANTTVTPAAYGSSSNSPSFTVDAKGRLTAAADVAIDHDALTNFAANEHFTEASIDHANIQSIGTNTHAQIDTHIADSTIHFTEASIDHTAIQNIGTNSHAAIDTHIADGTVHFTEGSIDHTAITNIGTNSHAAIDTHIADATIHFTEGSIDHTAIQNIGTNSHAAIDTHIADATIHFTEGSIDASAIDASAFTAGSIIFSDGANLAQDNSNLYWENTNKKLIVGDVNAESIAGINVGGTTYQPRINVNDIGGTNPAQILAHRHSTTYPAVFLGTRSNSDTDAHTNVANSQHLAILSGGGWSGSFYGLFGEVRVGVDSGGTVSPTSSPGRISFATASDGSTTLVDRVHIDRDGQLSVVATTASTSVSTGSVVLAGGMGVAGRGTFGSISAPGSGASSERFGDSASTSTHANATAVGVSASVSGARGTALGNIATAAVDATAEGYNARAQSPGDTAIGVNARAANGLIANVAALAIGYNAVAANLAAVAIGPLSSSLSQSGFACGFSSSVGALASGGIAFGGSSICNGSTSSVIGNSSSDGGFANVNVLGSNIVATAADQTILGTVSTEVIFGPPNISGATYAAKTVRFPTRSGSNRAQVQIDFLVGVRGTGTGANADTVFSTYSNSGIASGSTVHNVIERMRFNVSSTIFNENGEDVDFRIETDTNANFFVIDAGAASGAGSALIAGATGLIGLYGATPVIQYATTGTTTGFTAGAGTAVNDDSTFTGNTGATAYTIGDIVRALKLIGAIAS